MASCCRAECVLAPTGQCAGDMVVVCCSSQFSSNPCGATLVHYECYEKMKKKCLKCINGNKKSGDTLWTSKYDMLLHNSSLACSCGCQLCPITDNGNIILESNLVKYDMEYDISHYFRKKQNGSVSFIAPRKAEKNETKRHKCDVSTVKNMKKSSKLERGNKINRSLMHEYAPPVYTSTWVPESAPSEREDEFCLKMDAYPTLPSANLTSCKGRSSGITDIITPNDFRYSDVAYHYAPPSVFTKSTISSESYESSQSVHVSPFTVTVSTPLSISFKVIDAANRDAVALHIISSIFKECGVIVSNTYSMQVEKEVEHCHNLWIWGEINLHRSRLFTVWTSDSRKTRTRRRMSRR